jgi:hypothetical protein
MSVVTPFQVRDIWLATFAYERGVEFLGGYTYWCFEPTAMRTAFEEWSRGEPTVNIKTFHTNFMFLKGMIGSNGR